MGGDPQDEGDAAAVALAALRIAVAELADVVDRTGAVDEGAMVPVRRALDRAGERIAALRGPRVAPDGGD